MKTKLIILFLLSVIVVTGCSRSFSNLDSSSATGTLTFSVTNRPIISTRQLIQTASVSTPSYVELSLKDEYGQFVTGCENKLLQIGNFQGHYYTDALSLPPGNYFLTLFLVRDRNNNIVYSAPISESARAWLVEHPLPVSAVVQKKELNVVPIEVVTPEVADNSAYINFGVSAISTFAVLLEVVTFDPMRQGFKSSSANLTVLADSQQVFQNSISLIPTTSIIAIPDGFSQYEFRIQYPGFPIKTRSLSNADIKTYIEQPLIVELTP